MKTQKINRVKFDADTKEKVFKKTDGCCHICHKKLAFKNYGIADNKTRGNWEIDHSNPISKGGSNHINNYLPACVSCNRAKGNSSTASARAKHSKVTAPMSKNAKLEQVRNRKLIKVGAAGLFGLRFGPVGSILGMAITALSE